MSKNIVILLDGTSNSISKDRTNVLRLYGVLKKDNRQLVYYDPGVGTLGADGAWSRFLREAYEIWGLATGWGLDRNVKDAYRFIVENYDAGKSSEDGERDQIYIFGFSRGAYSARVLAGFIHAVGLMAPRNLNLLDYAYRAYKSVGENEKAEAFEEVRLYERILVPDRVPIRMLGLFDTVASVIESGPSGLRLKSHAFTSRNTSVESVSHAVALDERRTMFRPQLWPSGQEYWGNPFNSDAAVPQDVEEVWFAGGHGDVGGGYPEKESQLGKVALVWMIDQARSCGLLFSTASINSLVHGKRKDSKYVAPDPLGQSHNTMTAAWSIVEFIPRRKPRNSRRWSIFGITFPLFERRDVPSGAKIHASVRARQAGLGYWPANLPESVQSDPIEEGCKDL
ncbi:uncharacterized protein (DUF2235 family) [Rhodobium orientis]|uniref:T6SS Phospholipase effector Tle1-like catalytic domain-containing protein n=1 Tax=Rhodobium orientis TaxID=34017 RepID=A0A327JLA3_9HYPH|nr:DUF2235 domain-containing protein [Rhodobium orientis]MBB4303359.1 uncharacterized protein (DUF2235 family) [Rhodobium orientis]MBK5950294.1 hypothetical protein [Rhodobium orientis]RAI26406.1 hypothetical protein CH339_14460 [Rhodobium orientis]